MTAPKSILRARRTVAGERMPLEIEQWFSGETSPADIPWPALLPPTCDLLLHWWVDYWKEHPQAVPPQYVRDALRNQWADYLAAHPGSQMPEGLAGMLGDEGARA